MKLFVWAFVLAITSAAYADLPPHAGISVGPSSDKPLQSFLTAQPKIFDLASALLEYDTGTFANPGDEFTQMYWETEKDYYAHNAADSKPYELQLFGNPVNLNQASAQQLACAKNQQNIITQVSTSSGAQAVLSFAQLQIPGPIVLDNRNAQITHENLLSTSDGNYRLYDGGQVNLSDDRAALLFTSILDKSGQCHTLSQAQVLGSVLGSVEGNIFARANDYTTLSNMKLQHRHDYENALIDAENQWKDVKTLDQAAAIVKAITTALNEDDSNQPPVMTKQAAIQLACSTAEVAQTFNSLTQCQQALTNATATHNSGWSFQSNADDNGCSWNVIVSDEANSASLIPNCPPD